MGIDSLQLSSIAIRHAAKLAIYVVLAYLSAILMTVAIRIALSRFGFN